MPEGEIFIEKRRHKRVKKKLKVFYRVLSKDEMENEVNEKRIVESSDISISGIQLICDEKIALEQIIRLDIFIEENQDPLTTFAEVRWVKFDENIKKFRAGMEFLVVKEEHINIIKNLTGE